MWHGLKTATEIRWNSEKRHKDGLNNDADVAYSSKRETTIPVFEI